MMGLSRDNRFMVGALVLWGVGEGLFVYIQPLYLRQLGASPAEIGGALALAAAVAVVFHLPAGYVSDRLGRKQVLLAGWGLGLAATVAMFLATNVFTFTLALILYTITMFVGGPINGYVAEARGEQSVQRALTLVSASYWGGTIASPLLGGWIAQAFGLRWVYAVAVVMFILSTLAIAGLKPQPVVPPVQGQSRYGALFRNRRFLGFVLLTFFALLAIQTGLPLAPNFVQEVRGYDVQIVGLLGSLNSLGVVLFNITLGQRAPRRGFLLALVLLAASLVLLLQFGGLPWLMLAYILRAGWSLARNMANAQVRRVVSDAEIGLAFGVFETFNGVALTLAPLLAGYLYTWNPARPFQASLVLLLLAMPLFWKLAPRQDDPPSPLSEPALSMADRLDSLER